MDEKTKTWIKQIVASYNGDQEKAIRWFCSLPGMGGRKAIRALVSEALQS